MKSPSVTLSPLFPAPALQAFSRVAVQGKLDNYTDPLLDSLPDDSLWWALNITAAVRIKMGARVQLRAQQRELSHGIEHPAGDR